VKAIYANYLTYVNSRVSMRTLFENEFIIILSSELFDLLLTE